MKIIITQLKQGVAKKTQKPYAIFSGVSVKGKVIAEQFVDPELITAGIQAKALTKEDREDLFQKYETVNVSFDQDGRVEDITE